MRDRKRCAFGPEAAGIVVALADHASAGVEVAVFTGDELQRTGEVVARAFEVVGVACMASEANHFRQADEAITVQVLVARRREVGAAAAEVVTLEQRVAGKSPGVGPTKGENSVRPPPR